MSYKTNLMKYLNSKSKSPSDLMSVYKLLRLI